MTKNILPKACRTNTDSFRKEVSQDDVQAVLRKYAPRLRAVFQFYAKQTKRRAAKKMDRNDEASADHELDMDITAWIKFCKDFKVGHRTHVCSNFILQFILFLTNFVHHVVFLISTVDH